MLEKCFDNFLINIESAIKITDIYYDVLNIAKVSIQGAIEHSSGIHKKALNDKVKLLENTESSPILNKSLVIVREQQVVLIVSAFENYLKDVTKTIGNEYRSLIYWPEDKKFGKLDIELLKGEETTIGDLILKIIEQSGINFQDLQSILRFFNNYLKVDIKIDDIYKSNYILATAIRHVVVHNDAKVNADFKKQIRSIKTQNSYHVNKSVDISDEFVKELRDSILILADNIRVSLEGVLLKA